jgi:hypothetical protein
MLLHGDGGLARWVELWCDVEEIGQSLERLMKKWDCSSLVCMQDIYLTAYGDWYKLR